MTSTTRSSSSRERTLVSAESVILHKGFTGTSIDDIIDWASITGGGFFYHSDGKPRLAEALMRRYLEQDDLLFKGLLDEVSELTDQQ
jgi:TetR/AcrR family transcriptional repressor of nem operon